MAMTMEIVSRDMTFDNKVEVSKNVLPPSSGCKSRTRKEKYGTYTGAKI
jgi:hypothetical protein